MVTVYRVSAVWSGFNGAPGYSRFAFQNCITAADRNAAGAAVKAFFEGCKANIPSGTQIQVQGVVDEFDMATGQLTGSQVMTTVPSVTNSSATPNNYAGGAGFIATWNTSVIFNGHRIKGRTFIVPAVACFDVDGSLIGSVIPTIQTAGNTLCAAAGPDFSIWSRQYDKSTPPVQIGGAIAPADSCTVKDAATALRSRRV